MRTLLLGLFIPLATSGYAQFGVSYHQSSLPFIGFNYELKSRFVPELRVGLDNLIRDIALEAIGSYQIVSSDDLKFYAGAGVLGVGVRRTSLEGIVTPVGLNFYPFPVKKFGFHMEVSPIFIVDKVLLRGSWGIRYRFLK